MAQTGARPLYSALTECTHGLGAKGLTSTPYQPCWPPVPPAPSGGDRKLIPLQLSPKNAPGQTAEGADGEEAP